MLVAALIYSVAFHQTTPPAQAPTDLPKVAHQKDLDGEVKVGEKYSKEVEKELKLSTNEKEIARVQRIGAVLADIANHNIATVTWGDKKLNPFNYSFKVVEGDDINAFSLPGGFIYVYEGLLKFAKSDDELAGVLAHEISHASFRHVHTLDVAAKKDQLITIPLVLLSILGGGSETTAPLGPLAQLYQMARGSGWSVAAEKAADYGAVQYMLKSPYSPVGALTFMERLAKSQRFFDAHSLGIFQSHPPSKERADSLLEHLETFKVPIRRSLVSPAYRCDPVSAEGSEKIVFDGKAIVAFSGKDAKDRARDASVRLNEFFDSVPDLYEVSLRDNSTLVGRGRTLFQLTDEDAKAMKVPLPEAGKQALASIKKTLYTLAFRVWDTR